MEMKCLIAFLLLQFSWALVQGAGGFEGSEGMGDFGGFSLIQSDLMSDGAGASNETSNDTSTDPQVPGAGEQQLLFKPGGEMPVQADQPHQEAAVPTRLPNAGGPSTLPPLVRPEGNSTGNATTTGPPATETPKPKGQGDGSAQFLANFVLVLGGACVLHLLY